MTNCLYYQRNFFCIFPGTFRCVFVNFVKSICDKFPSFLNFIYSMNI